MQSQANREKLVKAVVAFLADTPLAPDTYERYLLGRFIAGELTIYQVLQALEADESTERLP